MPPPSSPPSSAGSVPYVELHAHSAFSFLDGASTPEEMAEAAAAMGHEALALTDHDGLCGSLAFAHAARAAGVRPITGAEVTLADGSHLTLLAATERGYANLCRLITLAHAGTRPPPHRRAVPPALPREALSEPGRTEGLVCLAGCARHGHVPRLVRAGDRRGAEAALRALVADFGRDHVHVEIQLTRNRGDRALARDLERLAEAVGVPAVATGDPHAHTPEAALLQDAFVAIGHRLTLDGSEDVRRGNHHAVLRPPPETAALFADHPAAVAQTLRVAERLEFDLTRDLGYRFPDFVGSHPGQTAQDALTSLCVHQLGARYPNAARRAAARVRLDEELALIA
ncbi:MAG TPA: PHP domain-containing protein, partial [Miltoncostaeaceae bacterium]|nr:PHP domain-containing protein [Miltoncostaeaceae bacterium]